MLALSKLSDYAIVLMTFLATHDEYKESARELAEATRIPLPTVVKLLKRLAASGTLQSTQGRRGGYRLIRRPCDVSITQIIEAVEGPIAVTECNREVSHCRIQASCPVHPHWRVINRALREALANISLADLSQPVLRITGTLQPDHTGPVEALPMGPGIHCG